MEKDRIALHLIKEDLKYHQVVYHMAQVEVHFEFYPDLASVIQQLLAPGLSAEQEEAWNNKYVREMSKARNISWADGPALEAQAQIVLEMLRP